VEMAENAGEGHSQQKSGSCLLILTFFEREVIGICGKKKAIV